MSFSAVFIRTPDENRFYDTVNLARRVFRRSGRRARNRRDGHFRTSHFIEIFGEFSRKFKANSCPGGHEKSRRDAGFLVRFYVPVSAEENLSLRVDGKNGFAFRAAEPSAFCRLEPLRADGAAENLRENRVRDRSTLLEEHRSFLH